MSWTLVTPAPSNAWTEVSGSATSWTEIAA